MSMVIIFPGQGSQSKGMGEALFNNIAEFADMEYEINKLLGYSLRELCIQNPDNLLSNTEYTQPCLYVVSVLHYIKFINETNVSPDVVMGHSLGEYTALWAAGAFDVLTGLRIVKKRGELMAGIKKGAMLAVMGSDTRSIEKFLHDHHFNDVDVANKNGPAQTVLSGPIDSITNIGSMLEDEDGVRCVVLPVSAAFHSRYMQPIRDSFSTFLHGLRFKPLKKKVISNVTGRPYPEGDPHDTISSLLLQQMTSPVEWTKSVQYLLDQGVVDFKEIGPGRVLTGLMDNILHLPESPHM